jgi:hypothetical protein
MNLESGSHGKELNTEWIGISGQKVQEALRDGAVLPLSLLSGEVDARPRASGEGH